MVNEQIEKNGAIYKILFVYSLLSISIGVDEDLVSEMERWNMHTAWLKKEGLYCI